MNIQKNHSLILPLLLSIFAAIVVVAAAANYNNDAWIWKLNYTGVITLATITFITTFSTAWFGFYTLIKTKHIPSLSAIFGIIWGSCAFVLIASVTALLFTPSPREFWRLFETAFMNGFFLGGFLGPIVGGIVGYWLAKQNFERNSF